MPVLSDFHLHSSFSGDSDAPMEEMVRRGISLGLDRMCFTEHMDLKHPVSDELPAGLFEVDTAAYRKALMSLREKYAGQIRLLFGIELGMQPRVAAENADYAAAWDFDFIIASTHFVDGIDPYSPVYFTGKTDEAAYRAYFEEELKGMQSFRDFDVYGHIDYVIRYGKTGDNNYCYDKYADLFDRMLELLLENGKGIELNTGGLRKGLHEPHPCLEFLKRYRQKGGEIVTVGSDAHFSRDIAADFDRAAEFLKQCGFSRYCTFEKRRPSYHRL